MNHAVLLASVLHIVMAQCYTKATGMNTVDVLGSFLCHIASIRSIE